MTTEQFIVWTRRDLHYLEGVADTIGNKNILRRVENIRKNLNEHAKKHCGEMPNSHDDPPTATN